MESMGKEDEHCTKISNERVLRVEMGIGDDDDDEESGNKIGE